MQVLTTTASIAAASRPAAQRARAGLGRERRRMREEAPVERVGIDREDLVERVEREPARLDAVVALQDRAGDEVRARVEPREPVGALERAEALGLGVARGGVAVPMPRKNMQAGDRDEVVAVSRQTPGHRRAGTEAAGAWHCENRAVRRAPARGGHPLRRFDFAGHHEHLLADPEHPPRRLRPRGAARAGQEKFIYLTNWYAEAEHGGFYQAVANGIYRKDGLDVTFKWAAPVNIMQLMAAGRPTASWD